MSPGSSESQSSVIANLSVPPLASDGLNTLSTPALNSALEPPRRCRRRAASAVLRPPPQAASASAATAPSGDRQ